jgi:hypothetical protein
VIAFALTQAKELKLLCIEEILPTEIADQVSGALERCHIDSFALRAT